MNSYTTHLKKIRIANHICPQTPKTVHTTCAKSKTLKIKYQMFLTVPLGIFIFVCITYSSQTLSLAIIVFK